jgi:type IV pilus biogenesis protein PilP
MSTSTDARVAGHATQPGAMNRSSTTLLGIYGPDRNLQAMVRTPGGSIRQVKPGSSLPAGKVVAIDHKGLVLEKDGETLRLVIPGS